LVRATTTFGSDRVAPGEAGAHPDALPERTLVGSDLGIEARGLIGEQHGEDGVRRAVHRCGEVRDGRRARRGDQRRFTPDMAACKHAIHRIEHGDVYHGIGAGRLGIGSTRRPHGIEREIVPDAQRAGAGAKLRLFVVDACEANVHTTGDEAYNERQDSFHGSAFVRGWRAKDEVMLRARYDQTGGRATVRPGISELRFMSPSCCAE